MYSQVYEAARELQRRRDARSNLLGFTSYTKPDYQTAWYHKHWCSVLDDFVAGKILRLMIFSPPQHGKSELVSRRLPAYILGKHPGDRIIATSYGSTLAEKMARDVKRIIDSDPYHALFKETALPGSLFAPRSNWNYVNNASEFEIVNQTGSYKCAGVGGGITGMGFKWGIIDDVIKGDAEARSQTYREGIWEWYVTEFMTRQAKDARILITLTRWHEDDLAGRLLKLAKDDPTADQWTVVRFPAIAEKEGERPSYDPRQEGEALWPERYPLEKLAPIQATQGRKFVALYQQRPAAAGGQVFLSTMFRYYTVQPIIDDDGMFVDWLFVLYDQEDSFAAGAETATRSFFGSDCWWFQTCDTAQKIKQHNDYTAIGTWICTPEFDLLLHDMFNDRIPVPAQYGELMKQRDKYPNLLFQAIEDAASGIGLIQLGASMGTPFRPMSASGDKMEKSQCVQTLYQNHKVFHRRTGSEFWLDNYESQLMTFPAGAHDDMVDVAGQAGRLLVRGDVSFFANQGDKLIAYPAMPKKPTPEQVKAALQQEQTGPPVSTAQWDEEDDY